ncbi:MAG TPA: VIT1/CCC1 transporter family protein [Candidatus Limnocylindria bacterium]|nr:VIT1/CCC1 transporter family protein [Candidatus Limnocylindria bacterium]
MASAADLARWRADLQGEVDGAAVYRAMAAAERDGALATVYGRLADAEDRHGAVWESQLRAAGAWTRRPGPSWRARVLAAVARHGGAGLVAPTMAGAEARDRARYDAQPEAGVALPREERSHARLLREIAGGASGPAIARLEGRHRATGGNALRAAVLGVNDGLVSNFSLVMGVAGAGGDARAALIAGLAGLLAGSLSMALGEWLSVQSARELFARQIAIESEELALAPEEEEEELALIYEAKGATAEQARALARGLVRGDQRAALDALSREELAIDPNELGGSAYVAAGTSFGMFAIGAIVPLVPYLVASGTAALVGAAALSAAALFGVGALITIVTGQSALRAGLRQLAIGVAAAAITYGAGTLLGTVVA